MNDLMDLRAALGEPDPPTHTAHSEARAALLREVAAAQAPAPTPKRQRTNWRRANWLTGGLGLTAAAAAAVVATVVAVSPTGTPATTGGHGHTSTGSVSQLSARQILLAAATSAAAAPASTGTYWYLKQTYSGPDANGTTQAWYTHDGAEYDLSPYRKAVYLSSWGGFSVGGSELSYGQIQGLPKGPASLRAWIIRSLRHPGTASVAFRNPPPGTPRPVHAPPTASYTPPPKSEIPSTVAFSLTDLLGQEPAPPAVRAAAFRALAAMPDVTKLGQANGNVILRISFPVQASKWPSGKVPPGAGQVKLFIDASTLALRATSNYQGTTTISTAGWTNSRPPLVSVDQAFSR